MRSETALALHVTPAPFGTLQRKIAYGGSSGSDGGCEEYKKKKQTLQRRAATAAEPATVPSIVHDVLNSPGQPLDDATRAFFELRFGHDFSKVSVRAPGEYQGQRQLGVNLPGDTYEQQADEMAERLMQMTHPAPKGHFEQRTRNDFCHVRVHIDAKAGESARAVNALAYTVGRDVVFGEGQYAPGTTEGKRLLAHELTHVAQQGSALEPIIQRKIGTIGKSGCSVVLGIDVGIYGSRATPALASKWQEWVNTLWKGTAACHGDSVGTCATSVDAKVTAHPDINWWWNVPEANSANVREPGYRSYTNTLNDSGDWAVDNDDRSIAHEVGHLMGQGDKYWDIPFTQRKSKSGFVNDIMANYFLDPGPTEYGPALTRILDDQGIDCLCCVKYPPCGVNNCALNPGLPCSAIGERRHCEWIRANNTPEAVAQYGVDCSTLTP